MQKIPLYNEKLDVTKKSENGNLKIEKKWITVKKEIEIPLKYEEIFINDKVFDSYSDKEKGEIFFQIKSKISDAFLRERTDEKDNKQPDPTGSEVEIVCWEPEGMELNKNVISEKAIPLSYVTMSRPNKHPTGRPNKHPTGRPSKYPTGRPSKYPTGRPSKYPTGRPSKYPTGRPSKYPTGRPSKYPTGRPSKYPTGRPSKSPGDKHPTGRPNKHPTGRPNKYPTGRPNKDSRDF